MAATPRELVHQTLDFERPARVPRHLWVLPIAELEHPGEAQAIRQAFPPDICEIQGHERQQPPTVGDPYEPGTYIDPWGCTFHNLQRGIIGEVKQPLIEDWDTDADKAHIPVERLTLDPDAINRDCAATDRFTLAAPMPRPFEQLQFLRGSENLLMDLLDPPRAMVAFMMRMHAFYCELLTAWAKTDVDGLKFMDDWGSQRALLISPALWRELFRPMYADYAQIAHAHGKKLFMHSDGHILAIYPDLIEIGIDAINSQVFCIGIEALAPFAGRITFWGEVDRQSLLPEGTTDEVDAAVRRMHQHLWRDGGCIAQCEFGAAARPANVRQVFRTWDQLA